MKKKIIVAIIAVILLVLLISNICFANSVVKNTYKLEENIIYRILPNTNLNEFSKHIANNSEIQIENNVIGTGKTATINQKEYKLVVCGDTSGDGKITKIDLDSIKDHILEKSQLSGLAFKAADINGDGSITASELTKISRYQQGYEVEFYKEETNIIEDIKNIVSNIPVEKTEVKIEPTADEDSDGLTNVEENELGTDIFYKDTDMDGLSDYEEVKKYKTNPLEKDTDKDGIDDLNEIKSKLNPLVKDSDGNGINDNEEIISDVEEDKELGIKLDIIGDGNISNTMISTVEIDELNSVNAIVSPIYDFNTSGNIKSAEVEIKYNETNITAKEIREENLSIYNFDPVNYTFEEVNTTIDTKNNIAKATLEHFSMYVLADKSTMVKSLNNQILFVIDNSASMYTYAQAVEKNQNPSATVEDLEKTPANDPEYKRLEIVSNIINNLDSKFEYGLAKFTRDYGQLAKMGSSKEKILEALETIKTSNETFNGTYISSTLYTATYEFTNKNGFNKYVVLISDGTDTAPSHSIIKDMAIDIAKQKNVKFITIGIGNQVNKAELIEYAEETGGRYFNVDNANMLNNLLETLQLELNQKRTTITNEYGNEEDYLVVADSGFIPEIHGLPYKNFRTYLSNGQCYGIAKVAQLLYMDELQLKANVNRKFNEQFKNFKYDLTNIDTILKDRKLYNYSLNNGIVEKIMFNMKTEELYNMAKYEQDIKDNKSDRVLEIKEEYKELIKSTGILVIKEVEDTQSKDFGTITAEFPCFDTERFSEEELKTNPSLQIIKAIEYYFMQQLNEEGTRTDYSKHVMFEKPQTLYDTIDKINAGVPVLISYQTSGGFISTIQWILSMANHTVNGITVLRNVKDTNKYKIAIYNNNNPRETQYLNVEKVNSLFGEMLCCYEQEGHCTNIYVEK